MSPNIERSPKKWRCHYCKKKLRWNDCVTVFEQSDDLRPGRCPRAQREFSCSGKGKRVRLPKGVTGSDMDPVDHEWLSYGREHECTHQCGECGHLLPNYTADKIVSRTYTGDRLPGYRGTFCNPTCAQDYAFKVVANSFGLPTLEDMPRTEEEKRNGYLSHRLPWLIQDKETRQR